MPEESSKKEARRRIDRIAKALRQFGLSDPGDIADALVKPPFPSLTALEKQVKALSLRLPPNISPRFVAEALLAMLNDVSPETLKWRERFGKAPDLASIKSGAKQASKYHRTIFGSLNGIFDGSLANGRIEQEINTGIQRVDIMFDNFSTTGFFFDVRNRLSLKPDYVPIECKNYSDDVGSPEYDQLGGRLNSEDRQIGVLVVRSIADTNRSLKHIKAKWEKRELVIVLDDDDIIRMHRARFDGEPSLIDKTLWAKVRSLRLNSVN